MAPICYVNMSANAYIRINKYKYQNLSIYRYEAYYYFPMHTEYNMQSHPSFMCYLYWYIYVYGAYINQNGMKML